MQKKPTRSVFMTKVYTKKELTEYVNKELDNIDFENHCKEVAEKCNVDPLVVKELLIDNSITVLWQLQKSTLDFKKIKINITGYFSLITFFKLEQKFKLIKL